MSPPLPDRMFLADLPEGILVDLVGTYCENKEIRRTRINMRDAHDASATHMAIRNRGGPSPTAASVSATVVRSPKLNAISIGHERNNDRGSHSEVSLGAAALLAMHGAGRADRLQELHLRGPWAEMPVSDTDALADAIRPFTGLREFSADCILTRSAARSILAALGNGAAMPHMAALDLQEYDLYMSGAALSSALERMPVLIELFLEDCNLDVQAARAIGRASATLRDLSLFNVTYDGPPEVLADSVNALIPRLEVLYLPGSVTGVTLGFGAGITALFLRDADDGALDYIDDVAALTGLIDLIVDHREMDYPRLAAAIGPLTSLKQLSLHASNTLSLASAIALAPTLGSLSSLRRLNLINSSLPPESVAALADALVRLTGLEELCMKGAIGSDGAAELARALERMPRLTTIHLDGNRIGPAGLAAIAPSLAALTGLVDLDLSGNKLAGHGRHAALRAAMLALTRLTRLDLSSNGLNVDYRAEISGELKSAIPTLKTVEMDRRVG